ncbi:MAG: hypothetical protein V3R66_07490 [Rhodospirillales bacterium]
MRFAVALFFVFLLTAIPDGAFAGQLVIVDSSAPDLTPGQIVDSSKILTLAEGTHLTAISEDGTVVKLKGPFSGPPGGGKGSGGGGLTASLSKLVGGGSASTSSLGVMRAKKSRIPPGPWDVNVARSGNHCVKAGEKPSLWRAGKDKAATITIKALGGGGKASRKWSAGDDRAAWPEGIEVRDGGQYLARISGKASAAKLIVHVVPAGLPSDAHRAAWMADKGCSSQARALLADLL